MDIPVRFVERPLDESQLQPQTDAFRSDDSLYRLTITETGVDMLTALVGRGMPPLDPGAVGRALLRTVAGQRDWDDMGIGDLFTEVYGEVFGPLITCLQRNGDFEVIRLVAPGNQTCPDVLLLERDTGLVILEECKATYIDLGKVRMDPNWLDVCAKLRDSRNEARSQLVWPVPQALSRRRVRIGGKRRLAMLPVDYAEEAAIATAVPDGRLRNYHGCVNPPPHAGCTDSCTNGCLLTPDAALMCVLSTRKAEDAGDVGPAWRAFLGWYKASERALWGRAAGSLGGAFAGVLRAMQQLEFPYETIDQAIPVITGPLEAAVQTALYVDFGPVHEASAALKHIGLMQAVAELQHTQGDVRPAEARETTAAALGGLLFPRGEERREEGVALGNWAFRTEGPEGEGTPVETHVRTTPYGLLEVLLVPRELGTRESASDVQWAVSEIISGGEAPREFVYEAFTPEVVSWTNEAMGIDRDFTLGKVLGDSWPFWFAWPWFADRGTLERMRHCCPDCDMLAHEIERWRRHLPFPPFEWPHFLRRHHRHHHHTDWALWPGPIAFVTEDARGVIRLPMLGPH